MRHERRLDNTAVESDKVFKKSSKAPVCKISFIEQEAPLESLVYFFQTVQKSNLIQKATKLKFSACDGIPNNDDDDNAAVVG